MKTLNSVPVGDRAVACGLKKHKGRRLLDLGFVPGTPVEVLRASPLGDPRAYLVRGAVIALRKTDAELILVGGGGEHE